MAGRKGRSGRKSKFDENMRNEVTELCWRTVRDYLNSAEATIHQKAEMAVKVVVKGLDKPIQIDNSKHEHYTSIDFKSMQPEQIVDYLFNRNHGLNTAGKS